MDEELLKCINCDSDPFTSLQKSPNTGKTLVKFHQDQGHTVVKYDPKIHEKRETVLGNCIAKQQVPPEEFKEDLRNEKLRHHETREKENLLVLQDEFEVLRPITITKTGSKFILVYLPTQVKDIRSDISYENRGFFVTKDANGRKEIISADDRSLREKFVVNIPKTYSDIRWSFPDISNYCKGDTLLNPKDVYEQSLENIKKYFDYQDPVIYDILVLWNIHTYFFELFGATPYLDFTGTKRAGKSKNLEYQSLICYNAIKSSDISPSALFRLIESVGPTLLLDETENFRNTRNDKMIETRTLLNAGFMKHDNAVRSEGKNFTPTQFRIFGPKSLAHINSFDDVLEERCIPINTIRSTNKKIINSDPDKSDKKITQLRYWYYRLFLDYGDEVAGLIPEARKIPDISSRELKIWTPILTLALFFENHGIGGLVAKIKDKSEAIFEERSQNDEEHSQEGRFLKFLDEVIRPLAKKDGCLIQFKEIYVKFRENLYKYGFEEYHKGKFVSEKLKKLGFPKGTRNRDGIPYDVSDEKLNAALERMNIPYQTKLKEVQN